MTAQPIRYPNQSKCTIHRKETPQNNFLLLSNDSLYEAAKNLSYSTFTLYMYLVNNADKFELFLSPTDVQDKTGIKKSTYHKALKELKEKHYYIQPDPAVNNWEFYETPQK